MNRNKGNHFLLILAISVFNITLSYAFGNNGYEAFITISIALGILITWQLLQLVRLLFRTRNWLIVKILGLVTLGFFWVIAISGIMLSVSGNAHDPAVTSPEVNWLIVLIGSVPYLLPRVSFYKLNAGFQKTAIGTLASLYSVIVLFIAMIGFYDTEAKYRGLVLVLAVQLQYLMNHIVVQTNYIRRSHMIATRIASRLNIDKGNLENNLTIFLVGLPFFLPLIIVMFVSSLN